MHETGDYNIKKGMILNENKWSKCFKIRGK